jgi:hypothetical protein
VGGGGKNAEGEQERSPPQKYHYQDRQDHSQDKFTIQPAGSGSVSIPVTGEPGEKPAQPTFSLVKHILPHSLGLSC